MIHKIIYKLGEKKRNPDLREAYNFLKTSEKWSLEQLQAYQLESLKKLLAQAYGKSSFYKKLYDDAGVDISEIKTLDDLKKLPIVTKTDVRVHTDDILIKEGFDKLFFSETSGSTGEPLLFYKNGEWDSRTRAAMYRGYSWYGVNPWDRNGYSWGFSFDRKKKMKTKMLDELINRFRIFSYTDEEIARFAKKLRGATYFEGYSSMIYEVAKKINQLGLNPINLKMVKGTSEKIYENYQGEVQKAFGQKIISEYGSTETGITAFECPCGNMHIAMENVIVEEVDGHAVITNLLSHSFPFIRYELGDSIVLDNETQCPCGMKHLIVKDVLGRIGCIIYGKDGKYPSFTMYYIFKNFALKYLKTVNYQAIQKEKGKMDINLDREVDEQTLEQLYGECYAYFGDDIEVKIHPAALVRDYTKKFRDFVCEVEEDSEGAAVK